MIEALRKTRAALAAMLELFEDSAEFANEREAIFHTREALDAADAALAQADAPADERVAFEAWADDQGFLLHRTFDGDQYQDLRTQGPWEAWQARAASAPAAPEPVAWQRQHLVGNPGVTKPVWTGWEPCSQREYEFALATPDWQGRALAVCEPASAPAAPGWMDIETAPKDGTPVLVFNSRMVLEAWFSSRWGRFVQSESGGTNAISPSHWMPLPAAPKEPT